MKNKQFILNTKVFFENNAIQYLKKVKGKHALIISDLILEQLGYVKEAQGYLGGAGIKTTTFTNVSPDPDVSIIAEGLCQYQQSKADLLIALGGGSVIDTAKAILYSASQSSEIKGADFQRPLFIAIPSTSGTGSEVTDFSVITVKDEKICIVDEMMAPDIAILDAACKKHLPVLVTVDTGIDVLVHAIEAYVSQNATDFTDALAEKAIYLIFQYLPVLYCDPTDLDAREHIQNASCLAGMAFTNAGLGITHSMAHAFGGKFHISHGRANAFFITEVLEFNARLSGQMDQRVGDKLRYLGTLLGLSGRTVREGAVSFIEAVRTLKKTVGIEDNIKNRGIDRGAFEAAVEQMAETALNDRCTPTNPNHPTKEQIVEIYFKSYYAGALHLR